MKIVVVDHPASLASRVFQKELLSSSGILAYVLQSEWMMMTATTQLLLEPHRRAGKIIFVPIEQLSFEDVFIFRSVHRMSGEAMTLLTFCRQNEYIFYSEDPALRRVARELDVVLYTAPISKTNEKPNVVLMKLKK
jgi:hypothetical protein